MDEAKYFLKCERMPGRKCHAKFHHTRVSADGRAPRLERWMTSLFKEPVSVQLSASKFPQDRWFGRRVTMSEVITRRKAKPLALAASWLIFCFAFKFLARASGSSTKEPSLSSAGCVVPLGVPLPSRHLSFSLCLCTVEVPTWPGPSAPQAPGCPACSYPGRPPQATSQDMESHVGPSSHSHLPKLVNSWLFWLWIFRCISATRYTQPYVIASLL